jgi:hypothetical protein
MRFGVFDRVFHWINRRVLLEDKAIVESSPDEVPLPREERSVRTDSLGLAFRKRYLREFASKRSLPLITSSGSTSISVEARGL